MSSVLYAKRTLYEYINIIKKYKRRDGAAQVVDLCSVKQIQ